MEEKEAWKIEFLEVLWGFYNKLGKISGNTWDPSEDSVREEGNLKNQNFATLNLRIKLFYWSHPARILNKDAGNLQKIKENL